MVRYIAFLRGINVGGQKLIKMEKLGRAFTSFGLKNVRTYIQSGNVIFDAADKNPAVLTQKIEKKLHKLLGYNVNVLLRTFREVEDIVKRNPFKGIKPAADIKMYVTFLSKEPAVKLKIPLKSSKEGLEVSRIDNRDAFILSRMVKGRFGFPNNFLEKELGGPATTRNWTTVNKVIK